MISLKKLSHIPVALACSALISACSSSYPSDVDQQIQQETTQIMAVRDVEPTPNVFEYSGIYVQQLTERQASLPDWYHMPEGSSFAQKPLHGVLDVIFKSIPVKTEYREGVVSETPVTIKNARTIGDILQSISSSTGYRHEIISSESGDVLVFSKYVTKDFPIRLIGGNTDFSIGKKNLRQTSGSNNQSQGDVTSDLVTSTGEEYSVISGSYNPLHDIKSGVDKILGCKMEQGAQNTQSASTSSMAQSTPNATGQLKCANGASAIVIGATNSIFVKALPSQIDQVDDYINNQTDVALRQVRVTLTLFTVQTDKNRQLNLDFDISDTAFLGTALGINHTTSTINSIIGGLDSPGNTILNHANGSTLAFNALDKQGTILQSDVLRAIGMNNRVAQLTKINKLNYISGRGTEQAALGSVKNTIEQKVAESGALLYILANIGENDVVLHLSSSKSALTRLDIKGDAENRVESPVIDDNFISTSIRLRPGRPVFVGGSTNNELRAVFANSGIIPTGVSQSAIDNNIETVILLDVEYI